MRRRDISARTQGSSSTGQSLRHVAILYSSFQSWFSVNTGLVNTFFFFFFFFTCCIHIPSEITLPRWGILVCECRDLIHFRMKWASSCLSTLCSYERLLQGLWSSNKNLKLHLHWLLPCKRHTTTHANTHSQLTHAKHGILSHTPTTLLL